MEIEAAMKPLFAAIFQMRIFRRSAGRRVDTLFRRVANQMSTPAPLYPHCHLFVNLASPLLSVKRVRCDAKTDLPSDHVLLIQDLPGLAVQTLIM